MKKFYPDITRNQFLKFGLSRVYYFLLVLLFVAPLASSAQYCGIWYVQSGASGTGTPSNPADFATALASVASGGTILMEQGTYTFNSTITVPGNVIIDGGYTVDASFDWIKGTNTPTILNISPALQTGSAAGSTVGFYIGITASGNGFELKDLTINVGSSGGNTNGFGNSVYGIYLNGQTGFVISRCAIATGTAGTGANGGTPGGVGSGNAGGAGGAGGAGALNQSNGCLFCTVDGGCGACGSNGSQGSPGTQAWGTETGGGGGGNCCSSGCNTADCGSSGCDIHTQVAGTGAAGVSASGYTGAAPTPNNITDGYLQYYVPVSGSQGYSGDGGGGGGGGGGAAAGTDCSCSGGSGQANGGNGGDGGAGGAGGFGGFGGGGSFGIYAYNSSGTAIECSFLNGGGGTAGNGGTGQVGAGGSVGAMGFNHGGCDGGYGGQGGTGGSGGQGGTGQAGLDGPGISIESAGSTSITQTSDGSVPTDGVTDADWVRGCTNSEVTLIKNVSDTWGTFIGTDAQFVDNLTATTSTYNSSSDTVIIYYPTTSPTGDKDVAVGTTDLSNFIRLTNNRLVNPTNSFISAITNPCPMQSVNLSNTLDVAETGDIVAYEWQVSDVAAPGNILYTYSTANPGAVGPPGGGWTVGHTYQVRFRIEETCCGWSIPMWSGFTIDTPSVAPNAINASANPLCNGSSTTLSFSTGTLGTDATWQWYTGSCGGTPAGTGTSISVSPTAPTTYYLQATGSTVCATTACVSITIAVDTPSAISGSPTATPSTICVGSNTNLQYTSGSLGTGAQWVWYATGCGSGTSVGTGSSITVSPLTTTTYYVRAEVSGLSGCTYPTGCTSVTVTVNQTSVAATGISATSTSICNGSSTSLSPVGGALGAGANWYWFTDSCGGTGFATGSPVSVSPDTTTTYYLSAEGTCDTTSCVSLTIHVSQPSTAPGSITANPTPICNGDSSTLIITSGTLGTGATWTWYAGSCGGGVSIGTGDSLIVNPIVSTTYYARAEGSGPCTYPTACTNVNVVVNQPAVPPTGVTATVGTICNGSSTQLSVQGTLSTGATWQWYSSSCGGTAVGSGSSVTVSPTATTTYYVRAEGPSPCSPSTCMSITITVNQPSTAAGSVTVNPTAICSGQNSILSANGGQLGTGANWVWYAGGCGSGSSIGTGDSITVSPASTTTYYVRAEGPAPCPASTACAAGTVTFSTASVAPTSITGTLTICSGTSTTLSQSGGTLGAGATWQWYTDSCGGTAAGSGSSISVSPDTNTTYYVRAEGGCDTSSCASITVTVSQPSSPPGALASPSSVCSGQSAVISVDAGSLGTGATWVWYAGSCGGGSSIGSGDSITVNPVATTTYYVRAEGSGPCTYPTSCGAATITISQSSVAPTGVNASVNPVCSGSSTSLTVQGGTLGAGATWVWYTVSCGGSPVSSGSTISVNPDTTTTYYVRAEGACDTTACANITINVSQPSVAPTVQASPAAICGGGSSTLSIVTGTLGTGAAWVWYAGGCGSGSSIGSGTSIVVNPLITTNYFVRAEGPAPCPTTTSCGSVTVTISQASTPATGATATSTTICNGSSTTVSVQGGSLGAGAAWVWYSGGCGVTPAGSGASLSVNPTDTTTYYVRAEGACDTTSCDSITINVSQPSIAPGSVNADPSILCSGSSSLLSVASGSLGTGASWVWYAGGCGSGSSIGTGDSITVSPTVNTSYYVRAEGSGACTYPTSCASTTITISQPSVAATGINAGTNPVCSGSSTSLTVQGGSLGSGASWTWYSGGCGTTPVGTGSTISVSPNSTTTYYVRAEGACDTSTCVNITINVSQPSVAPSAQASPTAICGGGSSSLSVVSGTLGTGASWVWYAGSCGTGSSIGTGATISVNPLVTTTYYVRAEGPGPCATTTACGAVTVTVSQASTAPTGATATTTTICSGSSTTVSVQGGSLGAGAAWVWYSGGCGVTPAGSGASLSVNPTDTTTYYVRAEGACDTTSCDSITINVSQPSIAPGSVNADPSILCSGSSSVLSVASGSLGTGASWVWYAGGCGNGTSIGSGDSITVSPTVNTSYYVRAEGSGACTYPTSCASTTITISQPSVAATGISASANPVCSGTNTSLSVQGGSLGAGAAWVWYTGSCGGTFAGTGSSLIVSPTVNTTYYVRAEGQCDSTACQQITITTNPAPNGSISGTTTICAGTSATLTFNLTTGTGPFNVSYTDGVNIYNLTGINNGNTVSVSPATTTTYQLTSITDANGCTSTSGFLGGAIITVDPPPVINSVTPVNAGCSGVNSGSISIVATGGTPPLYYSIDGGTTFVPTDFFGNLATGNYNVVVEDTLGCSRTYSFNPVIINQATPLIQTDSVVDANCSSINNGEIIITASGGVMPYRYSLNGGATQPGNIFSNLLAGTYLVAVYDVNNCLDTNTVVVSSAYSISDSIVSQTNVSCFGGNNGAVTVQLIGGILPYTYSDNGITFQSSPTFMGLTFGNYIISLRDSSGCSASIPITITQPAQLNVSIDSIINISCGGGATGSIYIQVNGGTSPYTFNWNNDSTTQNLVNVGSGTYNVTVSDSNGCSAYGGGTISQQQSMSVNISSFSNLRCYDDSSGFIGIDVTGGVQPYTYLWSNGATTQDISNQPAGNDTVTVTDAGSCTATASFTLTQPASPISSTLNGTNVTCHGAADGAASVSASGGTPPYTYLWSNFEPGDSIGSLNGGDYFVIITDHNGCTQEDSILISEPNAITILANITNVPCNGTTGAINLTVSGGVPGYTFLWSNLATTQNISNLAAATYYVTVTDTSGCHAYDSAAVNQGNPIAVNGTVTDVSCFGGSNGAIQLSISGGTAAYNFAWSNGATTQNISSLSAGFDSVTVTDANNCSGTAAFTVMQPATAITSSIVATNVSCFGANNGAATLSVSGGTPGYTFLWSNFEPSQNLTNLGAGTYYVIITDAHLCAQEDSVTISEPIELILNATVVHIPCNGTTGGINLSVAGGTSPYAYLWSNAATTQDITGVVMGLYSVVVTDSNLCTAADSAFVNQGSIINLNPTIRAVSCNGGVNGSITLNVSGGAPSYSYAWSNGATTSAISGLSAGVDSVTVTDANNCSAGASFTITQPANGITSSVTSDNVSCYGGSNGTADVSASGGTPPYSYLWSNFQINPGITGLTAGNYYVIITDSVLCTHRDTITITQPGPIILTITPISVTCSGTSTGSVSVTASGGTPGYTYLWNTDATTSGINNIGTGTYYVSVTDSNNCVATDSAVVTQNGALAVTGAATNANCFGFANGSIYITVTGGVPAYSYSWSNGATTQNITNLLAGIDSVTVSDANGCSVTSSFTISQPAPIISSVAATNVKCYGDSTGTAILTVSGGVPPYSFLWSNFHITQNQTGLNSGTYYVIVTDSTGCQQRDSAIITSPPALVLSTSVAHVSCNGNSNGAVNLVVSGGSPAYSYLWSNAATTQNINNLLPQTYYVTVTDANQCQATDSAVVIEPSALVVNGTVTSVGCTGGANGAIVITVNGGNFPYSYLWSNGATTQNVNGLAGGFDTVTVTDANLCSATAGFSVSSASGITSSIAGTNLTCFGVPTGAANLTVNGGTQPYHFLWNTFQSSQNISGLSSGTYYVVITDANSCTQEDSIIITQPPALLLTTTVTPVTCNGTATGGASVSVNGGTPGYVYAWSNDATTAIISNLNAATYYVTVTDSNLCTKADSAIITQPAALTASGAPQNVRCSGYADGLIDLAVNGGTQPYSFNWSNSATTQDIVGLNPGNYAVTITDANGCLDTLSFNISQTITIHVSAVVTNVQCYGYDNGTITLTINGGAPPYSFFWSDLQVSQNLANLGGGTYYVIVTDSNGCQARDSAIVAEPTELIITSRITSISCHNENNDSIFIAVTGGITPYSFLWSDSSTLQNRVGLDEGTYAVTVTDSNNCTASTIISIANPSAIVGNLIVTNELCFQDTLGYPDSTGAINLLIAGGTPGYTYLWSNGDTSEDIGNLPAGAYSVIVTDSRNCVSFDTATVTSPPVFYVTGFSLNVPCFNDSNGIIFQSAYGGTPPYSFTWSEEGTNFSSFRENLNDLKAGIYRVTTTDANNCISESIYTITQPPLLVDSMVATNVSCYDGSNGTAAVIPVGGTQPYSYLWNDFSSDSSRIGLAAGKYSTLITDSAGCRQVDSVIISQPSQIAILSTPIDVTCFNGNNGSVAVTDTGGTPGYIYSWSNGSTAQSVNDLTAGAYTLVVTDSDLCTVSATFNISQPTQIQTTFINSFPNCYGADNGSISVIAQQGVPPYYYQWSTNPVQTSATASNLHGGIYTVTLADANNCSFAVSDTLTQPDSIAVLTNASASKCYDVGSGQVIATVVGGLPPYIYDLSGQIQTSDTFYGLPKGNYVLLATDRNGCAGTGSFTIGAPSALSVTLAASEQIILTGMQTQLFANATDSAPIVNYFWSPLTVDSTGVFDFSNCPDSNNCSSPYVHPPVSTIFSVTVEDADSCFASDTITILVNNQPVAFIPTAFTPNGDGLNDRFEFAILGANMIEISIYDRWGERVYYNSNQANGITGTDGWDGTKNGKPAPDDTYVYQLKITYFDNTVKNIAGTVTIMR